jgi:hypothetical protein
VKAKIAKTRPRTFRNDPYGRSFRSPDVDLVVCFRPRGVVQTHREHSHVEATLRRGFRDLRVHERSPGFNWVVILCDE